jgi:hypothetical protein
VTVALLGLLVSNSLAQSFCSDLDQVVRLARLRFWAIRDEANRGALRTPVTQTLPGASQCWYEDSSRSYWCAWDAAPGQRKDQVRQLASAIGRCYRVLPAYDDHFDDEAIAFVYLPASISVYVNGAGERLTLSIGSTASLPEPYQQAP